MANNMTRLLITRPEPGASSTLKLAQQMGMDAVKFPFFEIAPHIWDAPPAADFDAIMLTSANALRHGGEKLRQYIALPAYCVGQSTANLAQQMGFDIAHVGRGGAASIMPLLRAHHRRHIFCPSGGHRAILTDEQTSGLTLFPASLYMAQRVNMTSAMIEAIKQADIISIYSARAAQYLSEISKQYEIDLSGKFIAALSHQIAAAMGDNSLQYIIPEYPDDEKILRKMKAMSQY
ncbi:hypothetical protein LPB140_00080 [Sphingorhabdus lutea]|uniref:Tetrapyrrole biosynthesis uroporphyrinogen III synthase domain-containing protein n=1 Tax=Sphingorhabdus lutea TaxID=1913578 RepID=A0A1L3J8P3_9SPHN|nr:uroporphyrinogen-III synthase [Sphingorhabdus lutea]APG61502.1 hypothetical protein LPB140_00080 [Sphingorhabdus lutea]